MDWVDRYFAVFVILGLIGFVLSLALAMVAVERLFAWGKSKWEEGRRRRTTPASTHIPATDSLPGTNACSHKCKLANDELLTDKAVAAWLESYWDEIMWWKEFLHHEGTGNRTQEEQKSADEHYREALRQLELAEEIQKNKTIKRWVDKGLTKEQSYERWQNMKDEIHNEARMRYAFQKD